MIALKNYGLPALILLTGLLYIFVIPSDPHAVKMLFKLIPMWLIIYYAYLRLPKPAGKAHYLLLAGLFFCMLGDWLLQWFVIGLTAFLIGHLFYMSSFFRNWRFSRLRAATLIPLALYGAYIGWELVQALVRDSNQGLIVPVLLYIAVIMTMTWSAIMTANIWAIVGSVLFTISDSILSWNMFVADVAHSGVFIMITYYSAQFCMAYSIRSLGDGKSAAKTASLSAR